MLKITCYFSFPFILGLAQAIVSIGKSDPERTADFASTISYESFNLDFQLKNIFVSAELEGGECFVSPSSVDVMNILSGILASFQHLTEEKNISISLKINQDSKENIFKTDAEKLHLILSNLIDNAIEYSPPGNVVNITVKVEQEHLKLSVQNFGELIKIPNKNIVFDRFKQLETGTKKRHKGHGLGLSLCKDLVDMMGGSITVSSTKSKGNVFSVSLPKIEQEEFDDDFAVDGNEILFVDGEKF